MHPNRGQKHRTHKGGNVKYLIFNFSVAAEQKADEEVEAEQVRRQA